VSICTRVIVSSSTRNTHGKCTDAKREEVVLSHGIHTYLVCLCASFIVKFSLSIPSTTYSHIHPLLAMIQQPGTQIKWVSASLYW
jgi:hypothetical protein